MAGDIYMIAVKEAIDLGLGASPVRVIGGPILSQELESGLLVLDSASTRTRQSIVIDKRHYEVRYIGETESSVEIVISRRVNS